MPARFPCTAISSAESTVGFDGMFYRLRYDASLYALSFYAEILEHFKHGMLCFHAIVA